MINFIQRDARQRLLVYSESNREERRRIPSVSNAWQSGTEDELGLNLRIELECCDAATTTKRIAHHPAEHYIERMMRTNILNVEAIVVQTPMKTLRKL